MAKLIRVESMSPQTGGKMKKLLLILTTTLMASVAHADHWNQYTCTASESSQAVGVAHFRTQELGGVDMSDGLLFDGHAHHYTANDRMKIDRIEEGRNQGEARVTFRRYRGRLHTRRRMISELVIHLNLANPSNSSFQYTGESTVSSGSMNCVKSLVEVDPDAGNSWSE